MKMTPDLSTLRLSAVRACPIRLEDIDDTATVHVRELGVLAGNVRVGPSLARKRLMERL